MVEDLFDIEAHRDGEAPSVVLRVHVQPAAGRTAVAGTFGAALKVRVAAPPEGNRANEACERFVAELFGVRRDQVEVISGPSSRSKRLRITGVEAADATRLLEEVLARAGASPGTGRTH